MSTNITSGDQQSWVDTPPINPPLRHFIAELVESQSWVEALANPFQNWLHTLFGKQGDPSYKVKDAIDGTWLGHPLHPVMVTIPLGAWACTTVLDLFSMGSEDVALERGADATLWIGLVGAMAAIPTGVTQWSDIDGPDRRVGLIHGLLNGGVGMLNLTSGILRLTGRRRTAIALSTTAFLTSLFTAYLGGELSYSKGIGVNHVAFEGGSDEFVPVMDAQDLPEGKLTRVDAAGIPAVLLKQGRAIYAIAATCSHLGGPLDEGTVKDGVVQCPWHGSCFRMTDGSIVSGPATYAQPTFAVRVRNNKIELRRLEHA
jgi:nitrite reductase/ring-hydroxylating ferredoxin subunit/uncharacterized membrane protein